MKILVILLVLLGEIHAFAQVREMVDKDWAAKYDSSYSFDNIDTLVAVTRGSKRGIVNFITGQQLVPPIYVDILPFITATGYHFAIYNEEQKVGVLNAKGQQVLAMEYDGLNVEELQYQSVSQGEFDRTGMLKNGDKLIIPVKYGQIDRYDERNEKEEVVNTAFIVYEDERPFLVDSEGQTVFNQRGIRIEYLEYGGSGIYFKLYSKKKRGAFGIGKGLIVPITYESVEPLVLDNNYYFTVKQGKKYGVIDGMGKIIVPIKYKGVYESGEGLFEMTDTKKKNFMLTKDFKIVEMKEE